MILTKFPEMNYLIIIIYEANDFVDFIIWNAGTPTPIPNQIYLV